MKNPQTPPANTPGINPETLQKLSIELINKCLELWRTYKDSKQAKGHKIQAAFGIHRMIIDALRYHPDIQQLKALHEKAQEVEEELAIIRKIHPITSRASVP